MLEEHKKQFALSAQSRNENKKCSSKHSWMQNKHVDKKNLSSPVKKSSEKEIVLIDVTDIKFGHFHKDCQRKSEASGCTEQGATTGSVGEKTSVQVEDLTESQL